MKNNRISVIMAVYKEGKDELSKSIESILNQTYKNFEYIIILDNPDELWRKDFIESYKDERIKLYINEKNMGLVYSLNRALKYVTGDYIARMDADDISLLDRFEKQLDYLIKNDLDLISSHFITFRDDEIIDTIYNPINPNNICKMLKYGTCLAHPAWFGKKSIFTELNGYRNIPSCEDYDFLIRASLKNYKLGNYDGVLLKYRLSPISISRSNPGKQEVTANYLREKYRKGKFVSMNEFDYYLNSKKYTKDLRKYNSFLNKISKFKLSKNIFSKLKYLIMLTTNINFIYRKIKVNIVRKKYNN